MTVQVYNGYGHKHDLIVFGHVLQSSVKTSKKLTNNFFINTLNLVRLFFVKPLAGIRVRLQWGDQTFESVTEFDGFFRFEWSSFTDTPAGWHHLTVHALNETNDIVGSGNGKLFVPHTTQYAFISDIDDTVIISHSATIIKRLHVLFTKHPRTRSAFEHVVKHYNMLALANTQKDVPNPFFYVSSSEWNLYYYLSEFFSHNHFPEGIFLLNQIKQLQGLLKTGKTKHEGKILRIARVLSSFPKQQFVLLGDNSQKDPDIYFAITEKYAGKIHAVYIRNVRKDSEQSTAAMLDKISAKGIHTFFYKDSHEAIEHSQKIGLINGIS